jgi:RNA polymerase-interacting CarD/CdnL/TRCF family regulator
MMFKEGDIVVHPARGAGIVRRIVSRGSQEGSDLYYRIEMLDGMGTRVMIPTKAVNTLGLRRAIREAKLGQVWRVLTGEADKLPSDHRKRYALLEEKLGAGDVLQTAEVVRDLAERRRRQGNLTTVGRRIYDKGLMFLVGELAAAQGIEPVSAEAQVLAKLRESPTSSAIH